MKNLNENQKQIVKELKDAFSGMNRKKGVSSGLIDVEAIVNEISEDLNIVEEIDMANKAFDKMIKEQMLEDIAKIDKDLSMLDLHILDKHISSSHFYITMDDGGIASHRCIKVMYVTTKNSVDVVGGSKWKNVSFVVKVDGAPGCETIEELINAGYFTHRLKKLHKIAISK